MPRKATAEPTVNKSEEIRKTIKSGVKKPKDIQAKLAERGIEVSTAMIYNVKSYMSSRRKARKLTRRRAAQPATQSNGVAATNIKALARFIRAVHEVGGSREAHKIMREMEE